GERGAVWRGRRQRRAARAGGRAPPRQYNRAYHARDWACAPRAATTNAGRACLSSAASRVSPPSRGSRPNTPAASATNSTTWTIHRTAGRRRRRCAAGAASAGCDALLAVIPGAPPPAGPVLGTALTVDRPYIYPALEDVAAGSPV